MRLERLRAIAEECTKVAGAAAGQEVERGEIENVARRRLAESAAVLQREERLLRVLPELVEKLAGQIQPIQQLRVLHVGDQATGGGSLPGSPISHLVQALTFLREAARFVGDEPRTTDDH